MNDGRTFTRNAWPFAQKVFLFSFPFKRDRRERSRESERPQNIFLIWPCSSAGEAPLTDYCVSAVFKRNEWKKGKKWKHKNKVVEFTRPRKKIFYFIFNCANQSVYIFLKKKNVYWWIWHFIRHENVEFDITYFYKYFKKSGYCWAEVFLCQGRWKNTYLIFKIITLVVLKFFLVKNIRGTVRKIFSFFKFRGGGHLAQGALT